MTEDGMAQSSARRRPHRDSPVLQVDPSMPRHQRRMVRAIGPIADRILMTNEDVLAMSDAIEETPLVARAILGAMWAPSRRVALLFTSRRLIEIGTSTSGWRALGRVRSFPWDGIPSIQIVDDWLEVRTWSGDTYRWYLHDAPDPGIEGRLNRRVNLAVSTFVPSDSRTAPLYHCSRCGAERPADEQSCRHCDATTRRPRLAGRLALAIPGGGHLYSGRPVAAVVRFFLELAIFSALAYGVLATTDLWRILMVMVAGFGLLAVVKFHGVWSARLLAKRAGVIDPRVHRRWQWAVAFGLVASIAVLSAPLPFAGSLEQRVTWDLVLIDSHGDWRRIEEPRTETVENHTDLRSVWRDSGGRVVTVRSRPLPPFQSTSQARSQLMDQAGSEDAPLAIGTFTVFPMTDTVETGETRITYRVFDSLGRDIHDLEFTARPGEEQQARDLLTWFLERSIWVRTAK